MPWSKPMTAEEWNNHNKKRLAEARAKFTWEDCAKQLAEQTELMLSEARWADELEPTGLHPLDVVDQLVLIFRRDWPIQGKMRAIKKIIEMEKST